MFFDWLRDVRQKLLSFRPERRRFSERRKVNRSMRVAETLEARVLLSAADVEPLDMGDAPDGYLVTLADNGARHVEAFAQAGSPSLRLGTEWDSESDGTHSPQADFDDLTPVGVTTVRVRLTDNDYLQLYEVEVFERGTGTALDDSGTASQSSTYNSNTRAEQAIDGDTTSGYPSSLALTRKELGAWWQVDLSGGFDVETIVVYNRGVAGGRLEGAVVEALDSGGNVLWFDTITGAANGSVHTFVIPDASPTDIALTNAVTSLAEDADTTSATKMGDIVITDADGGTNTVVLSGTDAASFEVVGSELFLKTGVALDYETKTSYAVTLTTGSVSVDHTLAITDMVELSALTYTITNDTVTITDCDTAATGTLVIPSTIEGKTVTRIGNSAFFSCTGLTSITLHDSVTSIGSYAFYDCTSLTSITLPDSITSIGDGAFWNCSSLTSITLPNNVTSIVYATFAYCGSLTSITLPNSVTSIGDYAFYECISLTSVTLWGNAPSVGSNMFDGVHADAKVYIQTGATGYGATFGGLPVVIPDEDHTKIDLTNAVVSLAVDDDRTADRQDTEVPKSQVQTTPDAVWISFVDDGSSDGEDDEDRPRPISIGVAINEPDESDQSSRINPGEAFEHLVD